MHPFFQNYKEKDASKVVLYTTSMGIVRSTYAKCHAVKQILRTQMVKFEERDVFMSFTHQQEIRNRMQSDDIDVPQLFVDGQYIGVSMFRIIRIINFSLPNWTHIVIL
jgi:glutaredoxin domain-containing cysteine-rich protein 1